MILRASWKAEYTKELENANKARCEGYEGKARVCARRAAGIVIGEYLHRRGVAELNHSTYELLALFNSLPDVDEQCKAVSSHFLIKVNQQHDLPLQADLIEDAAWLENYLLHKGID